MYSINRMGQELFSCDEIMEAIEWGYNWSRANKKAIDVFCQGNWVATLNWHQSLD